MSLIRMTLTNESILITADGIWIQPLLSDRFKFTGDVAELLSILVYHKDIDIDNARFYVRETQVTLHNSGAN